MKINTKKIVMSAMLAALCCVATMIIKIPSPFKGYINLGDCVVLLSGWMLPYGYGFAAAGIGSALADVFLGYTVYAPATFVIKGLMAIIAGLCYKKMQGRLGGTPSRITGGIIAEIFMVLGYFVFEGFLYNGFGAVAVNIPVNAVQGAVGLILGLILAKIFEKTKLS